MTDNESAKAWALSDEERANSHDARVAGYLAGCEKVRGEMSGALEKAESMATAFNFVFATSEVEGKWIRLNRPALFSANKRYSDFLEVVAKARGES